MNVNIITLDGEDVELNDKHVIKLVRNGNYWVQVK